MTTEETKLLDAISHRLAVAEAKIEALSTARYRELSLEERVDGAKVGEPEQASGRVA